MSSWLPEHRRSELKAIARRSHQVVTIAGIVGAATGLFVAAFDRIVVDTSFDHLLDLPLWLVAVGPGIGLILALAARRWIGGGTSPATADDYLHAFHDGHLLRWRPFLGRMIAAVATLGAGAPLGLEGPSLYAGATIGSAVQRRLPRIFREADPRVLLVAGAAAGVAAIFKTPATGAVFALEVPYQEDLARRMLLPALVAGASGYLTFVAVNGTGALLPTEGNVQLSLRDLLGAIAIGLVAGIGARLFAWLLRRAKKVAATAPPLPGALAAGTVLAALFVLGRVLTGESLLVGAGYQVVAWASVPQRSIWILVAILLLRCLATATAVAGGGVGGLFIPLVVAGSLTGSIIGGAVNHPDLELFVLIGVAAFLGAGYRVPLASVMFVAEATGRPAFVVPGLLAAVAAELLMGTASVTAYQRLPTRWAIADIDRDEGP